LTFLVALGAILLGDLNMIAPVLSMFFLTSYGLLNLSAGLEGLIDSPSWRPQFRVHPAWSFAGSIGCFAVMLMINPGATFIAVAVAVGIYALETRRKLKAQWGDIRYGLLTLLAGFAIRRLSQRKPDARTWRPNILVLSGAPQSHWHLIEIAHALAQRASSMTVAAIVTGEQWAVERIRSLRNSFAEYLRKRDVDALIKILPEDNVLDGAEALVKAYGYGPIKPNTILMGVPEKPDHLERFAKLILEIHRMDRNLVLVRENESDAAPTFAEKATLDIWWSGQQTNIGLILTLAYLLKRNDAWSEAAICLKRIVDTNADGEEIAKPMEDHIEAQRLEVDVELLPREGRAVFEVIRQSSAEASLVFLGLREPAPDETAEIYAEYIRALLEKTDGMTIAYVLASDKIDYKHVIGIG
jgi:hypothetical protein